MTDADDDDSKTWGSCEASPGGAKDADDEEEGEEERNNHNDMTYISTVDEAASTKTILLIVCLVQFCRRALSGREIGRRLLCSPKTECGSRPHKRVC